MPPKINKSCVNCYRKGTWATRFEIFLCSECRSLPKYILISKTDAKDDYFLTDDDISGMEKLEANGPCGPATYYKKSDLLDKFYEKYNTNAENYFEVKMNLCQERWDKIKEKRAAKELNKLNKIAVRKSSLQKALEKVGLVLYTGYVVGEIGELVESFTNLSNDYINNKIKPKQTIKQIVVKLCEMKYLYEYCKMKDFINAAIEENIDDYNSDLLTEKYIYEYAEKLALEKHSNGIYPVKFPWII
jgi:hypothetical protein